MNQITKINFCIFKSMLFLSVSLVFVLSANAQTVTNNSPQLTCTEQHVDTVNPGLIYQVVEKMPQFPGGEKALLDYIGHNLKYPIDAQEKGIQGRVIVRFIVTKTGKVEQVEVLRSLCPSADQEALRVISSLPNWIPGEQKGVKVGVYYTVPITFKLTNNSKSNSIDPTKKPLMILDGKIAPKDYNFAALNKDSIEPIDVITPDKKEKLAEIALRYQANTSNGAIIIATKAYTRQNGPGVLTKYGLTTDEKVYVVIEKMPEFPGGQQALLNYIGRNLRYPVEAQMKGIQGTVIVRFVVTSTGKVNKVEVIRKLFPALDAESVRVVASLPEWIPGEQKGKKVNVYYTLPIKFKLE
jgi:TonB family protein